MNVKIFLTQKKNCVLQKLFVPLHPNFSLKNATTKNYTIYHQS